LLAGNLTGSATGSGLVTIGGGGTLGGNGIIAGSVTVNNGGNTRPGLNGAVSTLNSNLTYSVGTEADFDLSSTYNGANGQVVLNGNNSILTCGGVTNGINLTGATLDTNHDYVLFNLTGTTPTISGSFNAAPLWLGTTPAVPGIFSIVKTNNTVVLHYAPPVPPAITAASVSPNPATRSQVVFVSTTITPGTGTINPVIGVTVNGGAMVGLSAFLVLSNNNVYTNSITVTNTTASGVQALTIAVTDSTPSTSTAPLSLTINPTTEIWNGADTLNGNTNWNDAANWANLLFPLAGDSLIFDGPTNLLPEMEGSYSIASLTFGSIAGSFNIITTNPAAVLTLAGGVTNNSANTQTLGVPLMLNAPVTFFAASANFTISGGIADAGGGLTVDGGNTVTLAGTNTYTGSTTVNAGKLLVNGSLAASSAVTVASGGTLGGTGTISGPATIQGGGTLSPGTGSIGTLAFGNSLTLTDGSTNLFKLNPSPLTNDAVIVIGALTNGGTLLITNTSASSLVAGNSFQLFSAGNYNGNFASVMLPALPVGLAWNTNNLNPGGSLSVVLTNTPAFGPVAVSDGGLVFSGSGGVGGANYILLEATNLATPPPDWIPILTNQFDSSGNFNFTNLVDPNAPQSFYRIQLQ
jgi:fibronectin-binding autotransporter adhesin